MNNDSPPENFKNIPKDTENHNPLEDISTFKDELSNLEKHWEPDAKQKENSNSKSFNQSVYNNLPDLLKYGCDSLTDATDKEVFLFGALGVISAILPNIRGFYDGKFYSPHLYVFVLANYGVGKGALFYSKLLAQNINRKKREQSEARKQEYEAKRLQYEKDLNAFKQDKKGITEPPEHPEEPIESLLFIPANNSRTGIFQLLKDNNGQGIIFETEGDTIADTLKQDWGNFSDGLRKAFHHESISYYRRTGRELVEIEKPCLAVVISSTYDQLLNLIPSIQNGLFSRFMFYSLKGNKGFKNVFDDLKSECLIRFDTLGENFEKIYDNLFGLDGPVTVELTKEQEDRFLETFGEWKTEIREYVSEDLDGTVNRLGLICFRIAMIFTALRHFEGGQRFPDTLTCLDKDFDNAMEIGSILKQQALKVFYKMPKHKKEKKENDTEREAQKKRVRELFANGMKPNEILKKLRLKVTRQTVYNWIHE